ncbi:MAG TPA: hypothetical protein EYO78_13780 [Gammaproteobacteria bacterium]|nr:hypothetical protein [Gammaproteobacteria bacterium]
MTSIRLFAIAVSVVLLGLASGSWSEQTQLSDDANSLPNGEDSSNIESEKESLDKSDKQEDLEERPQTPDSFEPSEAISEDIAVPFPVDI